MRHAGFAFVMFAFGAAAFLSSCVRPAAVSHDLSLPSGEHVTLVDTHGDSFTDVTGANRHVYYVSYETEHDIQDIPSLRKEVLRVWAVYVPQVIGSDYDSCVVTPLKAMGGSKGGRPFYLKKDAYGTWVLQN